MHLKWGEIAQVQDRQSKIARRMPVRRAIRGTANRAFATVKRASPKLVPAWLSWISHDELSKLAKLQADRVLSEAEFET